MDRRQRGGGDELRDIVAVRHGVERVGHRPVKAQRLGRLARIDGMRRARKGGGAQRRFVQARPAVGQAAAVAADHLDIGQQVMSEGDGLRSLQMGEARHDGRGIFLCTIDQRRLQVAQHGVEAIDRVADPQPHVEGDLVVARARRVQAPARRPDQVGESGLDVEMDVLELGRELEAAGFDLLPHLEQASLDGAAVLGGENALGDQHVAVGDRAGDVLCIESLVETDGGVDPLHDFRRSELVAPAPHRVGALPPRRRLSRSRSRVLPCHEYEPLIL